MIFVELHFSRSKVQQRKKKNLKPFLHKIRNICDTVFNDNIQPFLFHLYFSSKVQLIGSLCLRNMRDDEDMEFWLSGLGAQPPLAQPSSPPPLSAALPSSPSSPASCCRSLSAAWQPLHRQCHTGLLITASEK